MTTSFTFGFEYDDVDDQNPSCQNGSHQNSQVHVQQGSPMSAEPDLPQLEAPKLYSLYEILTSLPSSISYSTIALKSQNGAAATIHLPRRELSDIRAQLMAEDPNFSQPGRNCSYSSITVEAELSAKDDLKPGLYEGGFKTWECAVDLASYLAGQSGEIISTLGIKGLHVIELGAGTALPTSTILQFLITKLSSSESSPTLRLTLSDYNATVLHLATIPNILLTYQLLASQTSLQLSSDLDLSPSFLSSFESNLFRDRHIHISAVSGAWSPAFDDLITKPHFSATSSNTLILASETIYSPASLTAFTNTLIHILSTVEKRGGEACALIAAKKIYFGVGGGVDEFLEVLVARGGTGKVVWESFGGGVERLILEVRIAVAPEGMSSK